MQWTDSSAGKILERYRRLSTETADAAERLRILKLLAEEEAKFKLEMSRSGDGPAEVHASTRQPRIGSSMTERSSKVVASRKAAEPHANRLLGLLPRADYQRLRPHLHRFRWSTGSRSTKPTSPSDLSISSRPASVPW